MEDLDLILDLISDEIIALKIDAPLNKAIATCVLPDNEIATLAQFLRTITVLIKHLYREGLRPSISLSDERALSEAIWFLEKKPLALPCAATSPQKEFKPRTAELVLECKLLFHCAQSFPSLALLQDQHPSLRVGDRIALRTRWRSGRSSSH